MGTEAAAGCRARLGQAYLARAMGMPFAAEARALLVAWAWRSTSAMARLAMVIPPLDTGFQFMGARIHQHDWHTPVVSTHQHVVSAWSARGRTGRQTIGGRQRAQRSTPNAQRTRAADAGRPRAVVVPARVPDGDAVGHEAVLDGGLGVPQSTRARSQQNPKAGW